LSQYSPCVPSLPLDVLGLYHDADTLRTSFNKLCQCATELSTNLFSPVCQRLPQWAKFFRD